ncbi:hypothetical protein TNIN_459281 [Trichonephila inaurata madagascariensis]|uniref:Uncharacterized protein n=1 Tax=Trichonephila inaurata madagascariensis TaxID=2747483 RepID=A0A8X7CPA5_9ARAC|nr:hypothetical protein TNIN_459281 [Trichonephila inaurata madagascariensis]
MKAFEIWPIFMEADSDARSRYRQEERTPIGSPRVTGRKFGDSWRSLPYSSPAPAKLHCDPRDSPPPYQCITCNDSRNQKPEQCPSSPRTREDFEFRQI